MDSKASSPTLRYRSSPCPDSNRGNLQAVTSEWLSLTLGFSPSSSPSPTPPPFPKSFVSDLEDLGSLALTDFQSAPRLPDHITPQIKHGHFVPITSPKASHSFPESPTSPQPFSSSTCTSPPPATRFHVKAPNPVTNGININLNESKRSNFREMRGSPIRERKSFSNSTTEVCETAGRVVAVSKEDPLLKTLTEADEQEEEICEELLSIIQGGHSKCKDSGFYRRAPDVTEQLIRLHIEEEPDCDNLESPRIKREPMISFEGDNSPDNKKEVLCKINFYIQNINLRLILLVCVFLHVPI